MIELWHEWNSVQSFKVRVVLAEKDLQWTARRVDLLKFEQLQPDYLHLNPNGVVPTLLHDG
jgi:glutathione S-transferase